MSTKAGELYERALAGTVKSLGISHQVTISTLTNFADIYLRQGWYEEALKFYGWTREISREGAVMVGMIILDYAASRGVGVFRAGRSPTILSGQRTIARIPTHRFSENSAFLRKRSL